MEQIVNLEFILLKQVNIDYSKLVPLGEMHHSKVVGYMALVRALDKQMCCCTVPVESL